MHERSLLLRISAAALGLASTLLAQTGRGAFETQVQPFLQQNCFRCHGDKKPKAGVKLTSLGSSFEDPRQVAVWIKALEQVQAGLMPPRARRRPEAAARRAAVRWIERRVLNSKHGDAYRRKMALPQYGNWVDHHDLFSGNFDEPPFTRARLWRNSPYIFGAKRRLNRRVKGVQNPYSFSTPASGVRDYAATATVGSSVVETCMLNAASEIEWLFAEAAKDLSPVLDDKRAKEAADKHAKKRKRRRSNPVTPFVVAKATVTRAQMHAALEPTFRRVVDREPSKREIEKYIALLERNLAETGDARESLRGALTAIYLSPEALYRMEWGLGETDEHGRRMLSPDEMAYALSYALFDSGPKGSSRRGGAGKIRAALEAGKLATKADVTRVVDAILREASYRPTNAKRSYGVPRVMRFFREFFGFHRASEVFKDQMRVRAHGLYHSPRRLVNDTENLIGVLLRNDRDVFERLLSTREALVLHDGNNERPVARWEQAKRELARIDDEWAKQQTEKRLKGVAKKPKYRNNPKLLEMRRKAILREGKTLAARERKRLRRLIAKGPHMQKTKARDLGYVGAYNLSMKTWTWPAKQPFALPHEQRAGITTQPSWLVAHSGNDDTDPIHRGIWVFEKLLAGVLADVPPNVDARIPEDPHKTLRERMQPLRSEKCWKCHSKINPLGEAFEVFDDFGRFRQNFYFDEEGKILSKSHRAVSAQRRSAWKSLRRDAQVEAGRYSTRAVDAAASFDELEIPGLEGEFRDAVEMMDRIAKSERARQSIVRHLFRFFLGRNETLVDSRTLREADRAYVQSGGSLRAVITSLLSSDSFLYRR